MGAQCLRSPRVSVMPPLLIVLTYLPLLTAYNPQGKSAISLHNLLSQPVSTIRISFLNFLFWKIWIFIKTYLIKKNYIPKWKYLESHSVVPCIYFNISSFWISNVYFSQLKKQIWQWNKKVPIPCIYIVYGILLGTKSNESYLYEIYEL